MRSKALLLAVSAACLAGMTATTWADDGERLYRQMSSSRGTVANPEPVGEHAFLQYLNFYVPAQAANGALTPIDYVDADGTTVKTEVIARPLISFYLYGPVITFDDPSTSGFAGHGRRDAYAGVSLDDGVTWKRTNLSRSADRSSFDTVTAIPDPAVPQPEFVVTSETPVVTAALYTASSQTLSVNGTDAPARSRVEIRNAITFEVIGTAVARNNGNFVLTLQDVTAVPCSVQAGFTATNTWGPYLSVAGAPADCVGPDEVTLTNAYPGDVTNGIHAMAGNKIITAWQSKFCQAGFPAWSSSYDRDTVATYLGISNTVDLYLTDLFGVAGSQGSTDYREQEEFAGEYDVIGEIPHSCLWTARGVLRENPDAIGTTEVVWFAAERLTSGRRDVNRIEASCVAGAGCAVSWQEDPEGVRPGEGEGPGTGWAGATTSSQTDVWYSFVRWADFDIVDNDGTFDPLGDLSDTVLGTNRPKPAVPMMVGARLSNNARCQIPDPDATDPTGADYCNDAIAGAYLLKDQCIDTTDIPLGPSGTLTPVCVVDSNGSEAGDLGDMPNVANTAASRPRLSLQPRDSNGDGITDDAWVMIFAEEDKGIGRFGFPVDVEWTIDDLTDIGVPCLDPDADREDTCEKADIGKNIWWYSFAMGTPKTSVALSNGEVDATTVDFSLVNNLVSQGNVLNQPEVNWRTGTFYPPMSTADMWDFSVSEGGEGTDYNYLIFNTEIARRASMMAQSVTKAISGDSGLVAFPLWKQGVNNQGGPADIMARRIVVPVSTAVTACPIDDNDGTATPVVTSATYEVLNEIPYIRVQGKLADGDLSTRVQARNAVTEAVYGAPRLERNTPNVGDFNYLISVANWPDIPCAIQAADLDSVVQYGPWIAVTGLPETVQCVGTIPPECTDADSLDQAVANPYDVANMACEYTNDDGAVVPGVKYFTDGSNPYYPKGLCMAPAINLSGRTPFECSTGASGTSGDGTCPGESYTCEEVAGFGQLCVAGDLVQENPEDTQVFDKLLSWYECPGSNGVNSGTRTDQPACGVEPISQLLGSNQNDQSWYMPLEIAKGHRGFLDGDFVQMLYAWSPNFKDNSVGKDRYELYVRRSFDGGATWTTTPSSFTATDGVTYTVGNGTTTCETWRDGADSTLDSHVCTTYTAEQAEQSRNVSQLTANRYTLLDPRYAPTGTNLGVSLPSVPFDGADDWLLFTPITADNTQDGDPTDVRNPSRYFVVFETGDNTTTAVGEAEPLDLMYMRAEWFGDHYTVWAEVDTDYTGIELCFPNDPHGYAKFTWATGLGFCNEFDGLERKKNQVSGEASLTATAYGDFLYGAWEQETLDDEGEFLEGDAVFRRVWYRDDYVPVEAWTLPGIVQ